MAESFRCGFVALIGKPNTGKSTLMNALVGEKLSITAPRPQTTRHQILGIRTTAHCQCIFVDTPGLHREQKKAINRYMNRAASSVIDDVDLVCVLLDARHIDDEDLAVLRRLPKHEGVLLILNKIDLMPRAQLLPIIERLSQIAPGREIIPVSALKQENLDHLLEEIEQRLPPGLPQFPDDQLTDRPMRFIVAEIVREKLFRRLTQELPYALTVSVDHYQQDRDLLRISATIWVERKSQKGIIIGKGGQQLKQIGSEARADIERLAGQKVFLQLWVKLREGWSDDERSLAAFGYTDQ
jgi:GTP-binding protein Era